MKTSFLLFASILIVSCNTSSKQHANPNNEQNEVVVDNSSSFENTSEKQTEKNTIQDTLSSPIKIESTNPPTTLKQVTKQTDKVILNSKENAIKKPEKTAKKKIIVEKEVQEIELKQTVTKASHKIWDKLTKTYVSPNGKVNYKGFKSALNNIDDYLVHLQNTPPTKEWSKNEKLAYWFNLYNASTVYLVASNYPVKSIKDINGGKPWDKKFVKSGTHLYSLNDIENTLVRPNFNEPRLHVAFNCAAISCPNLLNEAFIPTKLNIQLNSLSKKWINDPSKNNITAESLTISQIFNWYKIDFKEGVIPFIAKYNNSVNSNTEITYMEYNWKLNE